MKQIPLVGLLLDSESPMSTTTTDTRCTTSTSNTTTAS